MNHSKAHNIGRISAYIFGIALLLIGIVSFGIQIESGNTSPRPLLGYVLAVVFIICGALTCLATRLRYGGGLWSIMGLNFVGFGTLGIASMLEAHLHGTPWTFPVVFYVRVTVFMVGGFVFLVLGQMRRQRIKSATIHAP